MTPLTQPRGPILAGMRFFDQKNVISLIKQSAQIIAVANDRMSMMKAPTKSCIGFGRIQCKVVLPLIHAVQPGAVFANPKYVQVLSTLRGPGDHLGMNESHFESLGAVLSRYVREAVSAHEPGAGM